MREYFNNTSRIQRGFKSFESKFKNATIDNSHMPSDKLPLNKRTGKNHEIVPPRSYREDPLPRTVNFENTVNTYSQENDNKLAKFTLINIPDVLDTEWLDEKRRMSDILRAQFTQPGREVEIVNALIDRELQHSMPLNREQRTIQKKTNDIANVNDTFNNRLLDIVQEVKNGRAENVNERKAIVTQLITIFNKPTAIDGLLELKSSEVNDLSVIIQNMSISRTTTQMGLPSVVDNTFFIRNRGLICVYLLGGAVSSSGPLSPDKPLYGINNTRPIGLFSMNSTLGAIVGGFHTTLLDLRNRSIVTIKNSIPELIRIVNQQDGSYNINLALNFNATQLKTLSDNGVTQDIYDSNSVPSVSIIIP